MFLVCVCHNAVFGFFQHKLQERVRGERKREREHFQTMAGDIIIGGVIHVQGAPS